MSSDWFCAKRITDYGQHQLTCNITKLSKYQLGRLYPEGFDLTIEGLGTPQPACGHCLIEVPAYVLPSVLGQVRLLVPHLIEPAASILCGVLVLML